MEITSIPFRDVANSISFLILILWIVKEYFLRKNPSKKSRILLSYAPRKTFLVINCFLIVSLLSVVFTIIIKADDLYKGIAWDMTIISLFLWFAIGIYARKRYHQYNNNTMVEVYKLLLMFIVLVIGYGIIRFGIFF